jgi:hypothetical protein
VLFLRMTRIGHSGGRGLACLTRKEWAHISGPIFYVQTMMDRGALWLVRWIWDSGQFGDGLRSKKSKGINK